jgi:FkbM family methyltransferase
MRKIFNKSIVSSFNIDYSSAHYNSQFWDKVELGDYEPDVQNSLKRYIDSQTIFFDVGAAEGCMSLIAASFGAQVIAYEPFESYFKALSKNVRANPEFSHRIKTNKAIISNFSGCVDLKLARGKYLSSITYNDFDSEIDNDFIPILDLANEISKYSQNSKIVVKMDIEGSEYSLLSDPTLLHVLKNYGAKLILAIHPGFFRPIQKSIPPIMFIKKIIFQIRNGIDNYQLFKRLAQFATVRRSNEIEVNSSSKFVVMSFAGVYEYNIHFKR